MSGGIKRCTDYSLTQVKSKEFIYTWKINNFKSLHPGVGDNVSSIKVSNNKEAVWYIQLYPDGLNTDLYQVEENYLAVEVFFDRQSSEEDYSIYSLIVCIVDKNGTEREFFRAPARNITVREFVSKAYLFEEENGLLPNGNLTLRFKVHFTSKVIPEYDNPSKSTSKINVFINFIRKNFTYFTNEVVHIPKLTGIMKSKLNELECMFNNEKFSDVIILAGGKKFYVYKGILATQSPVFAAMFKNDMRESNENVVHIADFDHEVVQELLRFIYVEKVSNLEVIARDLLALADKYELEQLKLMCEEALINDLNVDTVTSLLILADKYGAAVLKGSALEFFVFNVKEIIGSQTYKANLNSLLPLLPEILENLVL